VNALSEAVESIAYMYDANGNRTGMERAGMVSKVPEAMTATYTSGNRMATYNGESVIHDENGNLIQKGETVYSW
jgi:hypothetical protein